MARMLVTVIIDDLFFDSDYMIETMQKYTTVHAVSGINDVITALGDIAKGTEKVVDIILCDVNMDKDRSVKTFTLTWKDKGEAEAEQQIELAPGFEVEKRRALVPDGLNLDRRSGLTPYGPILALPFTRFFHKGGIIQPISNYWRHPRLLDKDTGHINGYVYVCLRLIMAQGPDSMNGAAADFGEQFSKMYSAASDVTVTTIYEEQFVLAAAQRRAQLLTGARAIEGLAGLRVEDLRTPGEVTIWNDGESADTIVRKSLFADFAIELAAIDRKIMDDGDDGAIAKLDAKLQAELAGYATGLDVDAICDFCCAFVDVMEDRDKGTFIQRYAEARLTSESEEPTVPPPCEPVALASHIRRYLLLSALLYIYAAKILAIDEDDRPNGLSESAMNKAVSGALGTKWTDHSVKEFAYGTRNLKVALRRNAGDRFLRPFWKGGTSPGWQAFNLLRRKGEQGGHWDWDDMDRRVAQAVWEKIGEDRESLPHGLGEA